LNKNEFEFSPKFKLWMVTNHKPIIRGTDYAIWRRIRLIPFTVTIPEAERDPQMADKLRAELPGILAWALRGCTAWLQNGLQEPEEVKAATNAYRNEQDVIAQFLDDTCVTGRQMRTECKALYAAYAGWCEMGGEHPVNQRRFGGQMTERGFDRERTSRGWVYVGVGLLNTRNDPESEANQSEQHDRNDPNDPIIPVLGKTQYMSEKPRSMDHLDHFDHEVAASGPATWHAADADWTEDLPNDLPAVVDVYANLKRLKAEREAGHG
jgi:putative DNA primase/helicase